MKSQLKTQISYQPIFVLSEIKGDTPNGPRHCPVRLIGHFSCGRIPQGPGQLPGSRCRIERDQMQVQAVL